MEFESFLLDLETVVKNNEKYLLIPEIRRMMNDLGYKKKVDLLKFSVRELLGLRRKLNGLVLDRIDFLSSYVSLDVPFNDDFVIQEQTIINEFLGSETPGYKVFVPPARKEKENLEELHKGILSKDFDMDAYVEKRRIEWQAKAKGENFVENVSDSTMILDGARTFGENTFYTTAERDRLFNELMVGKKVWKSVQCYDLSNMFTSGQIRRLNATFGDGADRFPFGYCSATLLEPRCVPFVLKHYSPRMSAADFLTMLRRNKHIKLRNMNEQVVHYEFNNYDGHYCNEEIPDLGEYARSVSKGLAFNVFANRIVKNEILVGLLKSSEEIQKRYMDLNIELAQYTHGVDIEKVVVGENFTLDFKNKTFVVTKEENDKLICTS